MKSVILSCPTLKGELLAVLAEHNVDIPVIFLPKELHRDPKYLHQFVQKTIDEIKDADRIYLCTTGCGGGTIGLKATTAEIVIPRTRDCLDVLLSGNDMIINEWKLNQAIQRTKERRPEMYEILKKNNSNNL